MVRLSHPASMEVVLRKRVSINVYKRYSITEKLKKKIGKAVSISDHTVLWWLLPHLIQARPLPSHCPTTGIVRDLFSSTLPCKMVFARVLIALATSKPSCLPRRNDLQQRVNHFSTTGLLRSNQDFNGTT